LIQEARETDAPSPVGRGDGDFFICVPECDREMFKTNGRLEGETLKTPSTN